MMMIVVIAVLWIILVDGDGRRRRMLVSRSSRSSTTTRQIHHRRAEDAKKVKSQHDYFMPTLLLLLLPPLTPMKPLRTTQEITVEGYEVLSSLCNHDIEQWTSPSTRMVNSRGGPWTFVWCRRFLNDTFRNKRKQKRSSLSSDSKTKITKIEERNSSD